MPAYDDRLFSPPGPIAMVALRNPDHDATLDNIQMLIDSGSDVTLVPASVVGVLGVTTNPDKSYELAGFDGRKSLTQAIRLDLSFLRRTFRGRYLLIQQDWGILGRDVLNHAAIVLDGPRLGSTAR